MKLVADKNIPFLKGIAEKYGEVTYLAGSDFNSETIKDADTLIVRTVTRFDEAVLKNTNVKLICSATIGFDHIDTEYCDAHSIAWRNAPGCNSGSVQQYIVSSLLILSQKKGFDLRDKTIGIVGVGNVGQKVAFACRTLGMKVLLNDPPRAKREEDKHFVSLETLKREADIITFHTPLVKEGEYKTYHLADTDFFASLGKKPIIINSARGGIIDTAAIKTAIDTNQISGAIIDCWENEPNIDLEYMNKVDIATPHIAGYSADGKANATHMSLLSIAEYFNLEKNYANEITIPNPEHPIIDLNSFDNSRVYNAILSTYNPMADCGRLMENPQLFRTLRNEYPLRREYPSYMLVNVQGDEAELAANLGFKI